MKKPSSHQPPGFRCICLHIDIQCTHRHLHVHVHTVFPLLNAWMSFVKGLFARRLLRPAFIHHSRQSLCLPQLSKAHAGRSWQTSMRANPTRKQALSKDITFIKLSGCLHLVKNCQKNLRTTTNTANTRCCCDEERRNCWPLRTILHVKFSCHTVGFCRHCTC